MHQEINPMKVRVTRIAPDAQLPIYATEGASAFDLIAYSVDGSTRFGRFVDQDNALMVGTGLAFAVPPGHVMLVNGRSGHGRKYLVRLANVQGWIDSDYRGELMLAITSDSPNEDGLFIYPGDRVAQAMIVPAPRIEFEAVESLEPTARGDGGFGSTGAR